MTDAQKALDAVKRWKSYVNSPMCDSGHEVVASLGRFTQDHMGQIEKALRLLAAVEAGTHKVVPIKARPEMRLRGVEATISVMVTRKGLVIENTKQLEPVLRDADTITSLQTDAIYDAYIQAAPDFFAEDGK